MPFSAKDFISTEIHEREVVLGDGKPHAVYFRELPNTEYKRWAMWLMSTDEDVRAVSEARLLAAGVCEPDGTPALTVEQAADLKMKVAENLTRALFEVNRWNRALEGEDDLGKD